MRMRFLYTISQVLAKLVLDMGAFKWIAGALTAGFLYVCPTAQLQGGLYSLFALVVLDTVTGFMCAWNAHNISSRAFSRVVSKLIAYGSLIIVAKILTAQVPGLDSAAVASVGAAITVVILTEAVSVLENIRRLGVALPFGLEEAVMKRLATYKPPDQGKIA